MKQEKMQNKSHSRGIFPARLVGTTKSTVYNVCCSRSGVNLTWPKADQSVGLTPNLHKLSLEETTRFQIKFGMTTGKQWGFTLIELLVVVLIIGILAAIAVPQYQKAVLKSRVVQLLTLADSLRDAQQMYYLENGRYATKFEDLVLELPPGAAITSSGGQASWPNKITAYTSVGEPMATYVYDGKHGIGIKSYFKGPHLCYSYTERTDPVCLSLGGEYLSTACDTAENLADGAHGCRKYKFP